MSSMRPLLATIRRCISMLTATINPMTQAIAPRSFLRQESIPPINYARLKIGVTVAVCI